MPAGVKDKSCKMVRPDGLWDTIPRTRRWPPWSESTIRVLGEARSVGYAQDGGVRSPSRVGSVASRGYLEPMYSRWSKAPTLELRDLVLSIYALMNGLRTLTLAHQDAGFLGLTKQGRRIVPPGLGRKTPLR